MCTLALLLIILGASGNSASNFENVAQASSFLPRLKNVRANLDINRELIVDDVIKLMVELELSVGWIPLNNYFHLGSIDEFKEYEYWYNYISALSD